MLPDDLAKYVKENQDRFIEELRTFIRQPSIAAQGIGVKEAAELLADYFRKAGVEARAIPVDGGNPIVYGRLDGEIKRTLVVTGHYDVQPPGPSEAWLCDPFSAEMKDGKIYGRGAVDDKGNLFTWVKAVETLMKVRGKVPVNLRFLFEGDEEIGSPSTKKFLSQSENVALYKNADAMILFDVRQQADDRVLLTLGWKAMLYIEIEAEGPKEELHSSYAPIAENPAWRLVQALQTLRRPEKVLVEGFYDDVQEFSPEDMKLIAQIPVEEETLTTSLGVSRFKGDIHGGRIYETLITQPTCNIAGLVSGYTGKGSKTILPSKALAKIDFRLVPNQDPEDIFVKVKKHLEKHGFGDLQVRKLGSLGGFRASSKEKIVDAVRKAVTDVFGVGPVVYPLIPGSGAVATMTKAIGVPRIACGIGYMHLAHRPNEYIKIEQFLNGVRLATQVLNRFGEA